MHRTEVKYPIDAYWRTVCPTCHAVDKAHVVRSRGNVLRIIANILISLIAVVVFIRLMHECEVCGAVFRPKNKITGRRCMRCGSETKDSGASRCPHCGWTFPEIVLQAEGKKTY